MDNDFSQYKAVIIDDTDIWLKTMRLWLMHFGFKDIIIFSTVKEFLDYFTENHDDIHICVVDYVLDGSWEAPALIKKMREMNEDVFIVSVSANFVNDTDVLETDRMKSALNAGANNVGIKDVDALDVMITNHLNAKKHENYEEITKNFHAFNEFMKEK